MCPVRLGETLLRLSCKNSTFYSNFREKFLNSKMESDLTYNFRTRLSILLLFYLCFICVDILSYFTHCN